MSVFFTADHHFFHANIITYCSRPFADAAEMTEAMIECWNKVISPGDLAYHLGDFAFFGRRGDFDTIVATLRRLNGQKHLLLGNHDSRRHWKDGVEYAGGWVTVNDVKKVKVGTQSIFLSHYAHRVWPNSHHGAWHLYGHSHGTLPDDPHALSMDVGVDTHGFYPYSYEEIEVAMSKKDWQPVDHHDEDTR